MASSGNFCTLNPLGAQGGGTPDFGTLSNGNLSCALTDTAFGTIGVTSGKWYWEWKMVSSAVSGSTLGWANQQVNSQPELGYNSPASATGAQMVIMDVSNSPMTIISDAPKADTSGGSADVNTIAQNNIIGIAADFDNDKWYFSINGSFDDMRSGQNPSTGSSPMCSASGGGGLQTIARTAGYTWFPAIGNWAAPTRDYTVNFGQDDTFGGAISAEGNADGNGFGVFKYAPPTGFLALCTANLPISDDIDPAQTSDDYPSKQFNIALYTGDASTSNAITGLGFQPDFVWIKARNDNNLYSNAMFDTSRGRAKSIFSDNSRDEDSSSSTQDLVSFDSDGFTVGTSYNTGSNLSGKTHVAWCWKANGGTTASNTEGATNSTVQTNTKAGFSIIQYVGTGSNTTIGHGLDTAPDFMIHKNRDTTDNFVVYARSQGASKRAQLNGTITWGTSTGSFNSTDPSSTLITLGSSSGTNASSGNYVCYAWHNVEGYQRFGTYIGNNTDNDGPFVYTGFRPRMIVIKGATEAYPWFVFDSARNPHNLVDKHLRWNSNDVEATEPTGARKIDFLSNGFRVMADAASINGDGDTYVYMAWGDVPFKYNNTF